MIEVDSSQDSPRSTALPTLASRLLRGNTWRSSDSRRRLAIGAVTLLAILFYGVGYWTSPDRPEVLSPQHTHLGWRADFDQGQYYRSIVALENENYNPNEHIYPIGYPLIGTLFYPIMPEQPFFVPDLACFLITCLAFLCICQMSLFPEESFLLCFFAIIWSNQVRNTFIQPWTDTPVNAVLMVLAYLALTGRRDRAAAVGTGICAATIFMTRPGDLIYSWPLMTALWFGWRSWRDSWRRAGWFSLGFVPLAAVAAYFSFVIHGSLVSKAYSHNVGYIGFGFAALSIKLYTFLVDGFLLFGERRTLITVFPFLLLVLPGLLVFIKDFKWRAGIVVATQACAVVYFLAFNDFWISNFFASDAIRYLLWLLPFACLYAYMSLRLAWRKLGWIVTGLLILLPVVAWILPQMSIHPVDSTLATGPGAGFHWTCQPNSEGYCSVSIELAHSQQFDILELRGIQPIKLLYAKIWIDGKESPMFRDHYTSLAPDGQTYVIFYGTQKGRSIKITIPPITSNNHISMTGLQLGMCHGGLALRNPLSRYHHIRPGDPLTSFSQSLSSSDKQLYIKAGSTYTLDVAVKNTGVQPWYTEPFPKPVHMGYRWFNTEGQVLPIQEGRALLGRTIEPRESGSVKLNVVAPSKQGLYILKISMVQERVGWFYEEGAKPLNLLVTVE